jgi:hypothetical protein
VATNPATNVTLACLPACLPSIVTFGIAPGRPQGIRRIPHYYRTPYPASGGVEEPLSGWYESLDRPGPFNLELRLGENSRRHGLGLHLCQFAALNPKRENAEAHSV